MPNFNPVNVVTLDVMKGDHHFDTDEFRLALSNVAPSATDTVLTDITQIADGGDYLQGGYALANATLTQDGSEADFDADDLDITATGAAIAENQYFVVYNNTHSSKALLGWYDYGAKLNLAQDESITVRFHATNGMFTLS